MKGDMDRIPTGNVVIYDDSDETCRYQIRRIRELDGAKCLTLLPASDPRVLMWFGTPQTVVPRGSFTFFGVDGNQSFGMEAMARIIDALPSGRGRMLAEMLGDRSPGQGEPSQAIWQRAGSKKNICTATRKCIGPKFDTCGQLRQTNRMGN